MQEETRTALPVRMFLVDDGADFTRIFQISLRGEKRASFEVETARTLESALPMLREKTFQLIPLDPGLPGCREDLETLKELGVPYKEGFLWGQPA